MARDHRGALLEGGDEEQGNGDAWNCCGVTHRLFPDRFPSVSGCVCVVCFGEEAGGVQ